MSDQNSATMRRLQLDAIAEVDAVCRDLGQQTWLRGGWAMDFCLGRITRSHDDVDFVVLDGHMPEIVAALTNRDWVLDNRLPIERQADLARNGVDLSIVPAQLNAGGLPVCGPGPWEGEPLPTDMFSGAGHATLESVTASFISPMSQIEFKLMTRIWRPEFEFRPKDEADVARLCHHLFHGNSPINAAGTPITGLEVRPATTADPAGISRLLGQSHAEGIAPSTLPQIRQESSTFLAVDDGQTVGLAVATFVDYGVEAYGMIEELVVDHARRGERIGTTLVDQCRGWLGDLGASVIFVSALVDAEAFYVRAGFERCTGPWLWTTPLRRD